MREESALQKCNELIVEQGTLLLSGAGAVGFPLFLSLLLLLHLLPIKHNGARSVHLSLPSQWSRLLVFFWHWIHDHEALDGGGGNKLFDYYTPLVTLEREREVTIGNHPLIHPHGTLMNEQDSVSHSFIHIATHSSRPYMRGVHTLSFIHTSSKKTRP